MKGKDLAIILIIAHKEILTENEKTSLAQCYMILNKYPIKLICPENLNVSEYKKVNLKCKKFFLNTLIQMAKQKNPRRQDIIKLANQLRDQIEELLPGIGFNSYFEAEIPLSSLLKPIIQNSRIIEFNIQYAIPEGEFLELLSNCSLDQVTKWEDLIVKYFEKPTIVQAYLKLSKRVYIYNRDMSRTFLEKAFRVADSISYKSSDWKPELLNWAYTCFPERANYFVLHSFFVEYVDRDSELLYYLSKEVSPWQSHFNEPAFFETYYKANYNYNIKLAEGLPEPDLDTSFIINHKETLGFEEIAFNYLIDLFDYPIIKIRQLALEALFNLYTYCRKLINNYALKKIEKKSVNQIEHFLLLLHSLSINHTSDISELINKLDWPFQSGHYNIQESFADLIRVC